MVTKGIRLAEGARLGSYEIRAHLGTGGMASVYRGVHVETGQEVALKVLGPSSVVVPQVISRFAREVEAVCNVSHPNVVSILEIGLDAKPPYIAMEYVPGRTLRAVLDEGPPPLEAILNVAIQLAEGLSSAHQAGIVHRDLKPENVIVRPDGVVKILDFGLSKSFRKRPSTTEMDESLTLPGMILGTLPYMSPEQAKGRRADFRADQFSLGAILYEMVTGVVAFQRETILLTLEAVIGAEPTGIEEFRSSAATDVRGFVERALAKSPDDRYASMREMKSALVIARRRYEQGFLSRTLRLVWERVAQLFAPFQDGVDPLGGRPSG